MKKAIIGMIISMVIVLGIGGFVTTINYYENRLAEADSRKRIRNIVEILMRLKISKIKNTTK